MPRIAMAIRGMRHLPPPSKNARNTNVVHLGFHQVPSAAPRIHQQETLCRHY